MLGTERARRTTHDRAGRDWLSRTESRLSGGSRIVGHRPALAGTWLPGVDGRRFVAYDRF